MADGSIKVTIGGEEFSLPPMVFYCLRRAHPHILAFGQQGAEDMLGHVESALGIIAAGLALEPNPPSSEDLSKRLRPTEMQGAVISAMALMRTSGIIPSGESRATGQPPAGRSIGTEPSPSSSPMASRAVPGTPSSGG